MFLKYIFIFLISLIINLAAFARVKVTFINSTNENIKYYHEMKYRFSIIKLSLFNHEYTLDSKEKAFLLEK